MTGTGRNRGRIQFLVIAAVFFGPLLFAAWLYFEGEAFQPGSTSNHGALLEPIVNLHDEVPGSAVLEHSLWLLLYEHRAACAESCREALYAQRQLRLMLGKEMDRVLRVFLHGEEAPDNLLTADENKGLITLQDAALRDVLDNKKPAELAAGGYYLIDPHGNLVMYFGPDLEPRDVIDDIKKLLKLSRIG